MHPDYIVGPNDLVQFVGEMLVDTQIAGEIAARKLGEIEAVVQNRPEHAVGEAVVVFLVILLAEIGHHITDVLSLDGACFHSVAGNIPAPADPHAGAIAQCGLYGPLEAASAPAGLSVRYGDAI